MPRVTSARVYPRGPVLYADIRLDVEPWRIQRSTGFRVGQEDAARAALSTAIRQLETGDAPDLSPDAYSVRHFGDLWIAERRAAGKFTWKQERTHLKFHLYPHLGSRRLGDVTKADMLAWVRELPRHKRHDAKKGGPLISPRTVHNIASTVRALFRAAVKRDLLVATPCVWDASDLPHRDEQRDVSRLAGGFSAADVLALTTDPRIPEDRRVLYAIEFLTGMRPGEAAMRRWSDWREDEKPLSMLVAASAWSSEYRVEKATKTRARKLVPVHPHLATILRAWRARGWARTFGRAPTEADLIVPAARGGARHSGHSSRCWRADLVTLELDTQVHYETRATFRSLAMAGGADLTALDLITHPTPRQAKDLYTRRMHLWPRMCEAVEAIRLPAGDSRGTAKRALRGTRKRGRRPEPRGSGPFLRIA